MPTPAPAPLTGSQTAPVTAGLVLASQDAVARVRVAGVAPAAAPERPADAGLAPENWRMTGASTAILDLSHLALSPSTGGDAAALSLAESRAGRELGAPPAAGTDGVAEASRPTVPAYRFLTADMASTYLRVLPVAEMSGQELRDTLAARRAYKQALFAEALQQLARQPGLADLPVCAQGVSGAEGQCAWQPVRPALGDAPATPPTASASSATTTSPAAPTEAAAAPAPSTPVTTPAAPPAAPPAADAGPPPRRLAVVIGINRYDDRRIPQLVGAVPDADLISRTLREALGYDVMRVTDARKPEVFAALNQLASQARPQDSLLVYYAGHGEMVETTDLGYWIPRDGRADDPRGWVSNRDLNKILAASASRQITVVSDSCFSGRFAQTGRIEPAAGDGDDPQRLRAQRAVTVMTSGGDEPVADTGRHGHSVFAWNLVERLRGLGRWASGAGIFAKVKTAVQSELPQTPQYGAAADAGHERGADFVFEPQAAALAQADAQRAK